MPSFELTADNYLRCYNLYNNLYLPITEFCDLDDVRSISESFKLSNGKFFPLPLLLHATQEQAAQLKGCSKCILLYGGEEVGNLEIKNISEFNIDSFSQQIFGVNTDDHPGIKYIKSSGSHIIAGKVYIHKTPSWLKEDPHHFTPKELVEKIQNRNFETIAGFQTRNVPHRAHEYLQRLALEYADGLLIQPLVGWKKPGDFSINQIADAYQSLIKEYYPSNRVIYAHLHTPMFYAGPREAIFLAIMRWNQGCTHFIVGRDHAGVSGYYEVYAAHKLCKKHKDNIPIEFLLFNGPYFCDKCDRIVTDRHCDHKGTIHEHPISGTDLRRRLSEGLEIPHWLARPKVLYSLNKSS